MAESPYRRPARLRRPPVDALGAVLSLGCWATVVLGTVLALAGAYELTHGGGDVARVVALVGLAWLAAGTGLSVLLAGGRRG